MGVCYYVKYHLEYINKSAAANALQNCLKKSCQNINAIDDINDLMSNLLLANKSYSDYTSEKDIDFSCDFEASYLYEILLIDSFMSMAPFLADGSFAYIEPDDYYYKLVVKNGMVIDSRNYKIRGLSNSDYKQIVEMDEDSGFDVADWIDKDDASCSTEAYGLFYNKPNGVEELIGYCTLGGADGVIEFPEVTGNDKLLSDVYIVPEYRHMFFAHNFIADILRDLENCNCYLYYLDDDLVKFYKDLDFEYIDNTDNVMVRHYE